MSGVDFDEVIKEIVRLPELKERVLADDTEDELTEPYKSKYQNKMAQSPKVDRRNNRKVERTHDRRRKESW